MHHDFHIVHGIPLDRIRSIAKFQRIRRRLYLTFIGLLAVPILQHHVVCLDPLALG
jgi:hypothetical protein